MLAPILSLVLAAPAPEPPAAAPKGPAPKVMVLNVDKDGRPYLEATVTVTKFVTETRSFAVLVNGQPQVRTQQVQVPVTTMEQRQVFLTDEGVTLYGPDGKKLEAKNLPKQAGPAPALVSADGKEVDPFYLPLARPGTLIVVAPALAGATTGDALTPPPQPGEAAKPR